MERKERTDIYKQLFSRGSNTVLTCEGVMRSSPFAFLMGTNCVGGCALPRGEFCGRVIQSAVLGQDLYAGYAGRKEYES